MGSGSDAGALFCSLGQGGYMSNANFTPAP
jgi:hypothetical protein